ncbi:MAG: DUF1295 domain-containing protein [Nocardioides sp.]
MTKTASLLRVSLAYAAALAMAVLWLCFGPSSGRLWLDALIADLLATLVIFGFSRVYRNSSFYDAYWSVVPPLLLFYWWSQSDGVDGWRAGLVALVVLLWAVRLTANWAYAWPGLHHEDWRYPLLRERAGRFDVLADLFGIHLIPTIQVFLGCLPMYVALTRAGRDVGIIDVVAVLVGVGAVALETISDLQMHRFVRERQPGQVMDRGVWSWSRHPNYFGELMFWSSLALFGLAAAPGDAWWLFVGVLAMLAMFLGASIPMMEERSLQRRPQYQQVIARVPMLVPRPPRRTQV